MDAKGRLAIPSEIRSKLRPEVDGSAWYAVPWPTKLIRLYTESDFQSKALNRPRSLTLSADEAELRSTLFGLSARIEMDGAGRIRIPEDMMSLVGLGPEVVLIGACDWLEVRDRGEWERARLAGLKKLPELMSRIAERGDGL
ncbi:MAG TPA: hypothetical protein VG797_05565 [Phycisphaerales bacterium]|nr:hypothetical protein [Phycisphaerales bacterium]